MALFGNTNQRMIQSVTTNHMTCYNEEAKLTVSFWNQQISLKLAPCIGINGDGLRSYSDDKSQLIMTALTADNIYALKDAYAKILKPAVDSGNATSISVSIGLAPARKIVTIGYDGVGYYLTATVNVDENGQGAGSLTYKFKTTDVIVDYDPNYGITNKNSTQAEFERFWACIDNFFAIGASTPHAMRYSEAVRASFANNNNGFGGGGFHSIQPRPVQPDMVHTPVNNMTDSYGDFPF